jgi:hypothetical protein
VVWVFQQINSVRKPNYQIKLYVYTPKEGAPVWEWMNSKGDMRDFYPGTTKRIPVKRFPSFKAAKKYVADNFFEERAKIFLATPPELIENGDGRTWKNEEVFA